MNEGPRRLVDDPEIASSLRDDLARAREEHHAYASAYDAASKAPGFQMALASQSGGAAGMGLLVKLALGTVAAVTFMFAGAALHARFYPRSQVVDHGAATVHAPLAPVVAPPVVRAPEVITPEQQATHVVSPVRPQPPTTRRAQLTNTQQEIRQLARIRAYLQSGDATRALQLAERGQRELGESALWQEREALAVLALFELERTEQAERRSAALLARFANSPFRAELEQRSRRAHEP